MKIEWKKESIDVTFGAIKDGEAFQWDRNVYIRVNASEYGMYVAMRVDIGHVITFARDQLVTPLAATLLVEEAR